MSLEGDVLALLFEYLIHPEILVCAMVTLRWLSTLQLNMD